MNALKKSCTVAVAKARRNSSPRRTWPSDTSVLVTVVPMLAPITIGTAASTVRAPDATRPTMIDVVADDDCTRMVATIPTHRAASGLETREKRSSCTSPLMRPIPCSRQVTPMRNT